VVREGDHCTLIDTGWDIPASIESLETQLAEISVKPSSIRKVLITHAHPDHLGLINRLKKQNNAVIYMHRNELDLIKVRYNDGNEYWPKTDLFLQTHGMPAAELSTGASPLPDLGALVPPDILFEGSEEIPIGEYTLRVINTPGHTPGHVSFYEQRKKFLISGDILLPTIATNAAGHIQHMTNPLQQYLYSLQTLKELDIDLVLPGHESPFTGHRRRIEELFERHRQRSEAVTKAFQSDPQPKTAYDVARLIPWVPRNKAVSWDELGEWDKRFALMQTIAHLEEQASAGKLTGFSQDGKLYYR
jgi:glyoxylase-like metal-dependent hydrolase (beta-lactamase superfamily II)